jgi:hypothetical protein
VSTAGVSFVSDSARLYTAMREVFERDWASEYAHATVITVSG